MKLIDADAAIDFVGSMNMCDEISNEACKKLTSYLDELPSVQPETNCSEIPNNSDTISRQAALEAIRTLQTYKLFAGDDMILVDKAQVQTELMMLPSIQPERPTGEWIQKPRYEDDEYPDVQPNLKCPFCGYEIGWCDMGNYCARCGADLRGDENE